jgi:hypothetical protein
MVTVFSVKVDNDEIVKLFIQRREIFRQLEITLPRGTSLLGKASLQTEAQKAKDKDPSFFDRFSTSVPRLVEQLDVVTDSIKESLKENEKLPASNIFLTFETEKAQREVLTALTVGTLMSHRNDSSAVSDPKYLFRGNHVLEVIEPEEPTTIRWHSSHSGETSVYQRSTL